MGQGVHVAFDVGLAFQLGAHALHVGDEHLDVPRRDDRRPSEAALGYIDRSLTSDDIADGAPLQALAQHARNQVELAHALAKHRQHAEAMEHYWRAFELVDKLQGKVDLLEPLLRSDVKGVLEAKVVLEVLRQRYPAAGTANTKVELKIVSLATSKVTDVDLALGDGYLARVKWFPDAKFLAVQRQTRDQKKLEMLKVDAATGAGRVILTVHPSFLLRVPGEERKAEEYARFVEDLRLAR